ncbi:MAG: glycosyltransferase [Terriglobales bacterium]
MPVNPQHSKGLSAFQQGRFTEALALLAAALQEQESGELWNDWATTQFQLGNVEEAEEGFRRALELDAGNALAAVNLGVLMSQSDRPDEAIPYLEKALTSLPASEQPAVQAILAQCRKDLGNTLSPAAVKEYLRGFTGKDENQGSYLQTHLSRYVATLELLPQATPGQTLLELGAAFHHLTPALKTLKGYEVRCSDVWEGEPQISRTVVSRDGSQEHSFTIDNFDVEHFPWPYPDQSFDVVLCCEMLEHLISDPMGVISEINRVLKPDGLLLLTTPNMASTKSVEYALRGESPYIYGRYEPGGRPTDHHNREYTANEVERLLELGGFQIERLFTRDSWWSCDRSLLRLFVSRGLPISRRGDNTFCLARRTTTVLERHPEEFYLTLGTQAERRDRQSDADGTTIEDSDRPLRILIVHELLPQTDRNGSDVRLMQIVRELCQQGHRVTYVARNGHHREYYTSALEDLGVKVRAHDSERLRHLGNDDPVDWTFSQVLEEGAFDLAILLMWFWTGISVPEHYMKDIRRLSPNTRVAVLTDDQHGLRELRMAELNGTWTDHERAEDYTLREFEVYGNADMVLSISEDDRRGLLAQNPDLDISLMPMVAELGKEKAGFMARSGFLFLGNFSNAANRDGAEWMLREVWPRVHAQLPEATLSLAGSNCLPGFGAGCDGVRSIGHVKDLPALFAQHRVFVAPIRFGTGIKTKNLSALGFGLPLVTTTIGAEGMNLSHDNQALIADSVEEFAAAMIQAYTDATVWQRLARKGRSHVSVEFGHKRLQDAVHALVHKAGRTTPRTGVTPDFPSYLMVEEQYPEVLYSRPARYRNWRRLVGYVQLAQQYIAENRLALALVQLRHVFGMPRAAGYAHVIFDYALSLLARCYRQIGDVDKASYYEQTRLASESPRRILQTHQAAPSLSCRKSPDISVIVPTYNRAEQLEICLAHLASQSLPTDQWEVVVVDDGSTDRTAHVCAEYASIYRLEYVKQKHAGIGAARRTAVDRAQGQYLLLIKDDTVPHCTMLSDHLRAQLALGGKPAAILGSRSYSSEIAEFALGLFIAQTPFFFAQSVLPAELQAESYYFTATNLSIAKEAVLAVGSFDPDLRVAEDIELGFRLHQAGCMLYKQPDIKADHQHLSISVEELIQKAGRYGSAQADIFKKHPSLLAEGKEPFGKLDRGAVKGLHQLVGRIRQQARDRAQEIETMNSIGLRQYMADGPSAMRKIEDIVSRVKNDASVVFWYHFLESFLKAWKGERMRAATAGA